MNGLKFTARIPESADILMVQEFSIEDLIPYLGLFEELEIDIWIDGGWGLMLYAVNRLDRTRTLTS
jgi:hypothetical protein